MHRNSASPASLHEAVNQGEILARTDGYSSYSKPSHSRLKDGGNLTASHSNNMVGNMIITCQNSDKLCEIWAKCIERCHSKTLKQLLWVHGKLWSISEVKAVLIAYFAFGDGDIKSRAERFLSSITNSIETVLRRNAEFRIILLSDGEASINHGNANELSKGLKQTETTAVDNYSYSDSLQLPRKTSRGSFNDLDSKVEDYSNSSPLQAGTFQSAGGSLELLAEGSSDIGGTKERKQAIMAQTKSPTSNSTRRRFLSAFCLYLVFDSKKFCRVCWCISYNCVTRSSALRCTFVPVGSVVRSSGHHGRNPYIISN